MLVVSTENSSDARTPEDVLVKILAKYDVSNSDTSLTKTDYFATVDYSKTLAI